MTCYYCGAHCNGEYWKQTKVGKVEVLAVVCKMCMRAEVAI